VVCLVIRNSLNECRIGTAVLINFFVPNAVLTRGWHLFGGGAYSSKYGLQKNSFSSRLKTKASSLRPPGAA